ncbi:MAG: hypothetical protein ACLFUV_04500 [Methanomassiliicoccales archaeon]
MAFASFHYEKDFEKKAVNYILNNESKSDIVAKKFGRVPEEHKDWIWGQVKEKVGDDLDGDQKARFDEVKQAIGK